MTRPSGGKKDTADERPVHVELHFYPYRDDTQAALVLATGLGGRSSRLRLWAGLLPSTRASLAGLRPSQLARVLCGELLAGLDDADADRAAIPDSTDTAVGPGAPVGATGATVIQDELPLG